MFSRFLDPYSYSSMNTIIEAEGNLGALWLGDYAAANDIKTIKAKGIKTVLTVAAGLNISYPTSSGITHKVYSILDVESSNIARLFRDTSQQIQEGLQRGSVLVHCAAGISRSVTIVIAYLMRKLSIPFNDAFQMVKRRRSIICPNFGFQRQLKQFERDLQQLQIQMSQTGSKFNNSRVYEEQKSNILKQEDYNGKLTGLKESQQLDKFSVTQNNFRQNDPKYDNKLSITATSAFRAQPDPRSLTQSKTFDKPDLKQSLKPLLKDVNQLAQSALQSSTLRSNSQQPRQFNPSQLVTTYGQSYGRPHIVSYKANNQITNSRLQGFGQNSQNYQNMISYHRNPYSVKY